MVVRSLFIIPSCLLLMSLPAYSYEYPLLTPADTFNWADIMEVPDATHEGNQVFHFGGRNKLYKNNAKATAFVEQYLSKAAALDADADVLRYASDSVTIKGGFYLEMGVGTGRSVNFLAALNPTRKIYGFDSFEGLPTDWDKGDKIFKAGMFGLKRKDAKIPLVKNALVYKGLFKEVLPKFKHQVLGENPIALLHIDSDTYQSAKDALTILGANIVPGTIIVFDEFYNYPNFEKHEWKAFQEFVQDNHLKTEYIAYNRNHEQVAVRIL